ncbi:uncharacterized protein K441DRAFT_672242, partial [Cenococcum geophilum 1.58]
MTSTSRLSTISPSTVPTARNTANPPDGLSSHYEKTKMPISTILFLSISCTSMETLSSI